MNTEIRERGVWQVGQKEREGDRGKIKGRLPKHHDSYLNKMHLDLTLGWWKYRTPPLTALPLTYFNASPGLIRGVHTA